MDLVVVLVCPASRRHHTQFTRPRAIEFLLLDLKLLHKLYAVVDSVGLKIYEVQSPTWFAGVGFPRKVDQLC